MSFEAKFGPVLSPATHRNVRQLIHFIDNGPAEGFTTGAYKEVGPSGSMFPEYAVWYEDATKVKKIVEKLIDRTDPVYPRQVTWNMYGEDGVSILATVVDTITYSGSVVVGRARQITEFP